MPTQATARWALAIAGALLAGVSAAMLTTGCGRGASSDRPGPRVLDAQRRAYDELRPGRFAILADFEDTGGLADARTQAGWFTLSPPDDAPPAALAVNITRTGAGSLRAPLAPGRSVVFRLVPARDLSPYSLLQWSVHSETIRDDLVITLDDGRSSLASRPMLLRRGWNTVAMDLARLRDRGADLSAVRSIRLTLTHAAGPVLLYLDDALLADNVRRLPGTPDGLEVVRRGLDYTFRLPGRPEPVYLSRSADGLWRFGASGVRLAMGASGESVDPNGWRGERLAPLGNRRIGEVEVVERNALRVRVVNRWHFPWRGGEWASPSTRSVVWEHTFRADGRWVRHVEINNADGEPIEWVSLRLGEPAAWADGPVASERLVERFAGPVGRWSLMTAPPGPLRGRLLAGYAQPGELTASLGAPGRAGGERSGAEGAFDARRGCYEVTARHGQCRFALSPRGAALHEPAVRVWGAWSGAVHAACEGLALRPVVDLGDGSVLLSLPGAVSRTTWVEVHGLSSLGAE